MFKKFKKDSSLLKKTRRKNNNIVITHLEREGSHPSSDDDDHDDDHDHDDDGDTINNNRSSSNSKNNRKLKKKKKNIMSFSLDDDDDNDDDDDDQINNHHNNNNIDNNNDKDDIQSKKKRQKKEHKKSKKQKKIKKSSSTSGGMGFGGMLPSHLRDDNSDDDHDNKEEEDQEDNNNYDKIRFQRNTIHFDDDDDDHHENGKEDKDIITENNQHDASTSMYSKEAMQKLKAAQHSYVAPSSTQSSTQSTTKTNINATTEITLNNDTINQNIFTSNDTFNHNNNNKKKKNENIPLPPLPLSKAIPKPPPTSQQEEDFIPLHSSTSFSKHGTKLNILSGDEALQYTDMDVDYYNDNDNILRMKTKNNVDPNETSQIIDDEEIDEGGRKWEEEISRRAGIDTNVKAISSSSSTASTIPLNKSQNNDDLETTSTNTNNSNIVISNVKSTIKTTLENLNQMEQDLESNIGRRIHDQQVSQDDMTKKEFELKEVGEKFEYYQNLRLEMVNWIGALRHLSERVDIVEKAIIELYREIAMKHERNWREWEDDVVEILMERCQLDYVVGRQPRVGSGSTQNETTVDEFGRDVGLLENLSRKKRRNERNRVREESKDRRRTRIKPDTTPSATLTDSTEAQIYDDSDLDVSDNEVMDKDERRRAYSDAMNLVLSETDDDYRTPAKLIATFEKWKSQYCSDYDQCYAMLALKDLMLIFVKIETCQKLDLLCFMKGEEYIHHSLRDFSWYSAIQQLDVLEGSERSNLDQFAPIVKTVIIQHFAEFFLSIVSQTNELFGSYNPLSTKETKSMTLFCKLVFDGVGEGETQLRENISSSIVQHINEFVQNLAIPVLNDGAVESDCENDVITYASIGQLYRLRKIVLNIVNWYSIITKDEQVKLAKFCLMDVIAYRFLPVFNISTKLLGGNQREEALILFHDVWKCVKRLGWFDIKDLILPSAPLRSVAAKYNVT